MLPVPKPFASLSSGLLARKGQARPAMRRQLAVLDGGAVAGDDLGWNDMGEPQSGDEDIGALPPVLAQREELAESLGAAAEPVADRRRAAFTLRLDAERHLRLRLASATRRLSAQRIVVEALDQFLKTMPELEPLAAGAPRTGKDRLGG